MKISIGASIFVGFLVLLPVLVLARSIGLAHQDHKQHHQPTYPRAVKGEMAKPDFYQERSQARRSRHHTVQVAGSSLPDCSQACESCSPCRLVMMSFACSSLAEAETCPMAYKCMCNGKTYPVP